jgi:hypothetical protein
LVSSRGPSNVQTRAAVSRIDSIIGMAAIRAGPA